MSRFKTTSHTTLGDPRAVDALLNMVRDAAECRALTVADPQTPSPAVRVQKVLTVEIERTPPAIRALYDEGIIGVLGGRR